MDMAWHMFYWPFISMEVGRGRNEVVKFARGRFGQHKYIDIDIIF
jgi:hypothetical protein